MTRYKVFILFCLLGFVINVNLFIDPVWGFIASLAGYFALNLVIWILVKRGLMKLMGTGPNTETGNWIGGA
ncbi:MAG: hypothetical protein V4658_13950, partial [Bacteroidota bacterium]